MRKWYQKLSDAEWGVVGGIEAPADRVATGCGITVKEVHRERLRRGIPDPHPTRNAKGKITVWNGLDLTKLRPRAWDWNESDEVLALIYQQRIPAITALRSTLKKEKKMAKQAAKKNSKKKESKKKESKKKESAAPDATEMVVRHIREGDKTQSSLEVARNTKGVLTFTMKIYGDTPDAIIDSMSKAKERIDELFPFQDSKPKE